MSQDTKLSVVELPTRQPGDAMEAMRLLRDLNEANEKGQLKTLLIVYFNPLGGWRIDMSSSMRLSELALASAAVQRELQHCLSNNGPLIEYPRPPDAA